MKSTVCRGAWSPVLFLVVSAVLLPGLLGAQPAHQVADVNTTLTGSAADVIFRAGFVNLGGTVLFTADDGRNGTELWRTDGTAAGTILVRDICPGACASRPTWMTVVGSELFFVADDGAHGRELWKSDGTAAGTQRVADITPGLEASNPYGLQELGGKVLFGTSNGVGQYALWVSDGTAAGTTILAGDTSNTPGARFFEPAFLGKLGNVALFSAATTAQGRELWRTDGTAAGTFLVADLRPGSGSFLSQASPPFPRARYAVVSANRLFFAADDGTHGEELWVSDGTAAGTTMVKDINAAGPSSPFFLIPFGQGVLFRADDGVHGTELWTSDGTTAGTSLVQDVNPGSTGSSPWGLIAAGSRVYFQSNDGAHGYELWSTDGSAAGTAMVADINPGSANGIPFSLPPVGAVGTNLLFFADDGVHGAEVWKTDGTTAGTALVADLNPGTGSSFFFNGNSDGITTVVVAGRWYFYAYTDGGGFEVWTSDGTAAGTQKLKEINNQASGFLVNWGELAAQGALAPLPGGKVLFQGQDGVTGGEPWVSDGTAAGTHQVADLWPGATGSYPWTMTPLNGKVLFHADTPTTHGLWVSDGTSGGTANLVNYFANGTWITPLGSFALFDGPNDALWRTDGTPGGTAAISGGSAPVTMTTGPAVPFGGGALLIGTGTTGNTGIWATDGTAAGTHLVQDFATGPNGGPALLTSAGTKAFFSNFTLATGRELWVTDGTAAGTMLVKDLSPDTGSGFPFLYLDPPGAVIAPLGNSVVFVGADGLGQEPWVSDGTAAGTVPLGDLLPGGAGSEPRWLTTVGNHVFFVADDGAHGRELWVTDGTSVGTMLVMDIEPGAASSEPDHLTAAGNVLLFSAWDSVHGRELWVSDGTPAGTARVQDIAPGALSASPLGIIVSGPTVYFAANDNTTGFELWSLPRTALGAHLTATKSVSGGFYEGGMVTYHIVLTNQGPTRQPDTPGPELVDVLPAGLAINSVSGGGGPGGSVSVMTATRTVTWDGPLAVGGSLTLNITATIQPGTRGTNLSNQATLAWDADADGINDAAGVSDDPAAAGSTNPTVITIGPEVFDFYTVTPCRVVDTRATTPLASGVTRTLPIGLSCGVPYGARAVAVNLTVVGATGSGYLILGKPGTPLPATSSLNFPAGVTRTNNAVVGLANGALDAQAVVAGSGSVQVVIDVSGYFQ
jgi:uncharacterized repeat protein (TIGR01451 family)